MVGYAIQSLFKGIFMIYTNEDGWLKHKHLLVEDTTIPLKYLILHIYGMEYMYISRHANF